MCIQYKGLTLRSLYTDRIFNLTGQMARQTAIHCPASLAKCRAQMTGFINARIMYFPFFLTFFYGTH